MTKCCPTQLITLLFSQALNLLKNHKSCYFLSFQTWSSNKFCFLHLPASWDLRWHTILTYIFVTCIMNCWKWLVIALSLLQTPTVLVKSVIPLTTQSRSQHYLPQGLRRLSFVMGVHRATFPWALKTSRDPALTTSWFLSRFASSRLLTMLLCGNTRRTSWERHP